MTRSVVQALVCALIGAAVCPLAARAVDRVTVRREGEKTHITGKTLIEAQDGGVLLMAPNGVLWNVPPDELVERTRDETNFAPLSADELAADVLRQLPEGFEYYKTAHYVICYSTTREYAQWCGSLFERLYRGFTNFWRNKGFELHDPEFPLVAIVFDDRRAYQAHARPVLKGATEAVTGYYSLETNRMTMYDLTGTQAMRDRSERLSTAEQVNVILSQPRAERNVATVVHEATHQIAFNCGLQTRYADIPLWVSEGIAVYFETPDLTSNKGWRGIGNVNALRLAQFRQYLGSRPADSIATLVADDKRFRDIKQATAAYAEAWALNYYLLKARSKQYVAYLQRLAAKPPLVWDGPEKRLQEFQEVFGDLEQLNIDLLRQIDKL
jgi:hypothetical protein